MFYLRHALETLLYLISQCQYAKSFWKEFEAFYESLTDLQINLTVKDIVIVIPAKECPLLFTELFNNLREITSVEMQKETRTSKHSRVSAES